MKDRFYIRNAKDHADERVTVRGWLYNKRGHGKVRFVEVRDGTGLMQCVLVKGEANDSAFEAFDELTQESSIAITGTLREEPRAVGGYEMGVDELEILQIAEPYPIQPKEHGPEFLLDNRHLWLRSSKQWAIIRVRSALVLAIRKYLDGQGFVLIDTPILTGSIGEEGQTLFETKYFDLGKAYLAQTGQLYLEAAMFAHNLVYDFGPTFRAEKSKTRRHLTEFWMVDVEEAFYDSDDNMNLQEEFVRAIVEMTVEACPRELEILERDTNILLNSARKPFARISYDDAIELLREKGEDIEWGRDIGGAAETIISEHFDSPVFIYDYPKKIKAFYMKQHPERPELVKCSDLIAPEGVGEIIGGSQREEDIEVLRARIREEGLPEEAYGWYLDLRKFGSVPHSGFGLGIERTVAWICGISHVREAIPFPRMIYRLNP
ncbi:MAG TPA: asparagine--tRNA ligase [candidate division Zixibacteria bacterium]|nr:asparagine--tRNA ligase [candidate division Zixibacteria bacterium]